MFIKFIRFALIGTLGTFVHYVVLYVLVGYKSYNPVCASGYGALCGMMVNYVLNFKLTFRSRQSHVHTFSKFVLVSAFGFALNLILMAIMTQKLYYVYAQILTTLMILFWNFFANMLWTFNQENANTQSDASGMAILQKMRPALVLLLTIVGIRLCTLGFYPLYDPSESRYAEMGRKMLETGNWVTPLIDYGVPFWGKPPLTVWVTALSLGLGGVNEFFARLPSVFLGVGIAGIIFHLVRVQRNRESAFSTTLILASSMAFFVMSGAVAMDQCLTFGITLALASFWLALREQRSWWGYIFFIGLSVGIMAKGPITLVLTGITIGLWTLITGRWADIWKRVPWGSGTLLMVSISLPWFLLAEQRTPGFLEYFIIGEHWKRFTESGWEGDLYGHGHAKARGTIWLYWLLGGFPWSLCFLRKIMNALLHQKTPVLQQIGKDDGWQLYCLLWMLSPLLFFTLSANIIWTYVLPSIPGLALLLCDGLDAPKKYRHMWVLCVPLMFVGAVSYYHMPDVEFFKSQKQLVAVYQAQAAIDENLVYFKNVPYSAQFYLQGKVLMVPGYRLLQKSLRSSVHNFYVFHQNDWAILPPAFKSRLVRVKEYDKFILLHAIEGK